MQAENLFFLLSNIFCLEGMMIFKPIMSMHWVLKRGEEGKETETRPITLFSSPCQAEHETGSKKYVESQTDHLKTDEDLKASHGQAGIFGKSFCLTLIGSLDKTTKSSLIWKAQMEKEKLV